MDRREALQTPLSDRIVAAIGAGAAVALLGAVLLSGLHVDVRARAEQALVSLALAPPPPPPPPAPHVVRPKRGKPAAASPPNLRAKATQVVAPPPVIVPPKPPPIPVAPVRGVGSMSRSGAADRIGPGFGAGGRGNGTGSGGSGDGDGGGDTAPEQTRGRLSYADLPATVRAQGVQRSVSVEYYVNVDGRVSGCRVDRSSGDAQVDAVTCALIEKRYRFRPSLDAVGRAVRSIVTETASYVVEHERDDDER